MYNTVAITLCRHRCAHCCPVLPGMYCAMTLHLLPILACGGTLITVDQDTGAPYLVVCKQCILIFRPQRLCNTVSTRCYLLARAHPLAV